MFTRSEVCSTAAQAVQLSEADLPVFSVGELDATELRSRGERTLLYRGPSGSVESAITLKVTSRPTAIKRLEAKDRLSTPSPRVLLIADFSESLSARVFKLIEAHYPSGARTLLALERLMPDYYDQQIEEKMRSLDMSVKEQSKVRHALKQLRAGCTPRASAVSAKMSLEELQTLFADKFKLEFEQACSLLAYCTNKKYRSTQEALAASGLATHMASRSQKRFTIKNSALLQAKVLDLREGTGESSDALSSLLKGRDKAAYACRQLGYPLPELSKRISDHLRLKLNADIQQILDSYQPHDFEAAQQSWAEDWHPSEQYLCERVFYLALAGHTKEEIRRLTESTGGRLQTAFWVIGEYLEAERSRLARRIANVLPTALYTEREIEAFEMRAVEGLRLQDMKGRLGVTSDERPRQLYKAIVDDAPVLRRFTGLPVRARLEEDEGGRQRATNILAERTQTYRRLRGYINQRQLEGHRNQIIRCAMKTDDPDRAAASFCDLCDQIHSEIAAGQQANTAAGEIIVAMLRHGEDWLQHSVEKDRLVQTVNTIVPALESFEKKLLPYQMVLRLIRELARADAAEASSKLSIFTRNIRLIADEADNADWSNDKIRRVVTCAAFLDSPEDEFRQQLSKYDRRLNAQLDILPLLLAEYDVPPSLRKHVHKHLARQGFLSRQALISRLERIELRRIAISLNLNAIDAAVPHRTILQNLMFSRKPVAELCLRALRYANMFLDLSRRISAAGHPPALANSLATQALFRQNPEKAWPQLLQTAISQEREAAVVPLKLEEAVGLNADQMRERMDALQSGQPSTAEELLTAFEPLLAVEGIGPKKGARTTMREVLEDMLPLISARVYQEYSAEDFIAYLVHALRTSSIKMGRAARARMIREQQDKRVKRKRIG